MKFLDLVSSDLVTNVTGGAVLGGAVGTFLSLATIGAATGLAFGLILFYKSVQQELKNTDDPSHN